MSDIDDYFDDGIDAAAFDALVTAATTNPRTDPPPRPVASTATTLYRKPTQQRQQTTALAPTQSTIRYKQPTIFGASQVIPKPSRQSKAGSSSQYHPPTASSTQQQPKVKAVKKWDRVNAIKSLPSLLPGKKNTNHRADDDEDEEVINDDGADSDDDLLLRAIDDAEHLHASIPMKLAWEEEAIKTWVYSINKPKRKYQYDIVAKALYNNCLVSLPTGLGKTFIAAVVMLNFYRWYPKGKVLFLAPTRPLVQQQIEACHSIAGIPSIDCVSLTGSVPASKRTDAWATKRVVFATPQTVANDLRRGILRPEDVICVVVDEAHKATGAYAYCVVVRLLMRFNPHFRVLALTATPGSDPEKVQGVIDNLHIGHVEVRTEESMDIKPYTKNKEIVLEKIPLTPELASIRDKWGALMLPLIRQCDSLFYGSKEPAYIHAFSITSAQMQLPREKHYLRPNLAILAKMATAMAKLLEYSIPLAYEKMLELKSESTKCASGVCSQVAYKSLMNEIGQMVTSPGFVPHPKMDKMKALTIEFFVNAQEQGKSPRLMIFCHFRDMVTDIVNYLNQEKPLIVASAFVGQSNDVKGNRGMNQKTQTEAIRRFKNNDFNVLVATSIGEEGLDIGALDCIICYEAQKSPLRMLQRLGRTGRNEDGKVIVLIAEGREDKNWEKAQDQYHHVQNALLSKKVLELYDDCERLIPEGTRPVPVEKTIDVQPYIAEQVEIDIQSAGKKKDKPTKRKRPGVEDMPPGAILGFVSAKDYQVPKSKADLLRERAEAALLTADETEVLKTQWCKNTDLSRIQPPLDVDCMNISYFSTRSPLGTRLAKVPKKSRACRNVMPSARFEATLKQCDAFVEDEAQYDAWKEDASAGFDEKNVLWWDSESRGTGARRPLRLCNQTQNPIRRVWAKFKDRSKPRSPRGSDAGPHDGNSASGSGDHLLQESSPFPSPVRPELSMEPASTTQSTSKPAATYVSCKGVAEVDVSLVVTRAPPKVPDTAALGSNRSNGFARLAAFRHPGVITLDPSPPDSVTLAPCKALPVDSEMRLIASKANEHLPLDSETRFNAAKAHEDLPLDSKTRPNAAKANKDLLLDSETQHNVVQANMVTVYSRTPSFSDDAVVPDSDPDFMDLYMPPASEDQPKYKSPVNKSTDMASAHPAKNPLGDQCIQRRPTSSETMSDDDFDFPELDQQALAVLDELEKKHQTTETQCKSTVATLPSKSPASPPSPSSPDDDFLELDQQALDELDELEKMVCKKPSAPSNERAALDSRPKLPATPKLAPSSEGPVKRFVRGAETYDEQSPLLSRARRGNMQPIISPSEYNNGDHFVAPLMLATQMPRNKRVRTERAENGAEGSNHPKKRILVEDSDEEEADVERGSTRGCESKRKMKDKMEEDAEGSLSSSRPRNKSKDKGKQKAVPTKRGNDWATKTGLFDLEASESDGSCQSDADHASGNRRRRQRKAKRSSSPEIDSENSIDRAFVVDTSSSNLKGSDGSPDKSMSAFYRASIMSQHPLVAGKFQDRPKRSDGQFKWKDPATRRRSGRQYVVTPGRGEGEDEWSYDSFCVPDEQSIEYDEAEGELTSEL